MGNCLTNCLGGGARDDETPLQSTPPPDGSSSSSNSSGGTPHRPSASEPPPPYSGPTHHRSQRASRQSSTSSGGHVNPLSVAELKRREEDEVARAKRASLLQHVPAHTFRSDDPLGPDDRECPICILDFEEGETVRSLPCGHTFHVGCIDDWLGRSFTCPSCCEAVDAALLSSFHSQLLAQLPSADVKDLESLGTSPAAAGPSSGPSSKAP